MPADNKYFRTDDIEYQVIYSGRRTLGISINPVSGVVARVPYRTPVRVVEKMIRDKSDWIKKITSYHSSLKRISSKTCNDGDKVMFMGKEHTLRIICAPRFNVRLLPDDIIEIGTHDPGDSLLNGTLLEKWFMLMAKKIFPATMIEVLDRLKDYKFAPAGFSVKRMKSRWGSCTSKGKISISSDLIRLSSVYAEYVIIHELCHLRHHNHGAQYYQLLTEVFPGWKEVRKELKKHIR